MGLSALVKGALAIDFTVTTGNLQQPVGEYSFQPGLQHFSYHTQSWFDFSQQQLNGFQYSGNWICLQMHLIGTLKLLAQPQGRR